MSELAQEITGKLERLEAAERLVNRLLDWALSNRGTTSEFVNCYTYNPGSIPRVLLDAKRFAGDKAVREYKVEGD